MTNLIRPDLVDLSAYGVVGREIFICECTPNVPEGLLMGWYAVEFDASPNVMDYVSRSGNLPASDYAGAFTLLIERLGRT